jgi:hypothetical protein
MSLLPNPGFLAKTESLLRKPEPFVVPALFNKKGKPHNNCPVNTIRVFLDRTKEYKGIHLFINPLTGIPLSKSRLAFRFKKFIKLRQDSLPNIHDMRKLGSSVAFWAGLSVPDILKLGHWKSKDVFFKSYLESFSPLKSSCVALGTTLRNSASSSLSAPALP